jgi:hypothetical protein
MTARVRSGPFLLRDSATPHSLTDQQYPRPPEGNRFIPARHATPATGCARTPVVGLRTPTQRSGPGAGVAWPHTPGHRLPEPSQHTQLTPPPGFRARTGMLRGRRSAAVSVIPRLTRTGPLGDQQHGARARTAHSRHAPVAESRRVVPGFGEALHQEPKNVFGKRSARLRDCCY